MVSPLSPQQFAPAQNFGQQLLGAVAQGQGIQQNQQALRAGNQRMAMNNQNMQAQQQGQQRQVSEYDYQTAVRRLEVINRLAKHARSLPTPQEREQFKQSLSPEMLQSVGIDPAQLEQTPIDDNGLDALIAQTQAALPQQQGTAGEREFSSMTAGLSEEEREKARRIQLGLAPRAVGSSAITTASEGLTNDVAGSEATIAGAKSGASEAAKLDSQLNKLPQVKSAVLRAEQQVSELGDRRTKDAQNQITMSMYDTAMADLERGLAGTTTGPLAGRLPAVTSDQQIAEGAVAVMAPLLKAMFRTAGEGTFTDKDQELLMGMLPTRKDTPEAREAKISGINAVVRAKLNQGGSGQGAATTGISGSSQSSSPSIDDLLRMY